MRAFNDVSGGYAIPTGRHSPIGGIGVRAGGRVELLEALVGAIRGIARGEEALRTWRIEAVARNLRVAGIVGRTEVPLHEYLTAVRASGYPREEAVKRMIGFMSG